MRQVGHNTCSQLRASLKTQSLFLQQVLLRMPNAGNIHAHLMPAVLLTCLLFSGALHPWPGAQLAFLDTVIPCLLCLLGSVCYHTMMANHWNYHRYLLIDVGLACFLNSCDIMLVDLAACCSRSLIRKRTSPFHVQSACQGSEMRCSFVCCQVTTNKSAFAGCSKSKYRQP